MSEGDGRDLRGTPARPSGTVATAQTRNAPGALLDPPRSATDSLVVGVLVKHGPAPFGFQPEGHASYFITVKTDRGERTIWGRGLERAIAESRTQPQVGEPVGVRENGIEPIAVVMRKRNAQGEIITTNRLETPRGHWLVERRDWFDERAAAADMLRDAQVSRREAIRNHPELLGAYWALDSAGKVAESRIKNPGSRERFVALVRETLAHAIERGESVPEPRKRSESPGRSSAERIATSAAREPQRSR